MSRSESEKIQSLVQDFPEPGEDTPRMPSPKNSPNDEDRRYRQYVSLPTGWTRQSIQLPIAISETMRVAAQSEGYGAHKLLGTAAVSVLLGMPKEVRDSIIDYVSLTTRRDPTALDPREVWEKLVQLLTARGEAKYEHFVDRILDPELTPVPGEKKSDKQSKKAKGA